jgi:hypothetical protein
MNPIDDSSTRPTGPPQPPPSGAPNNGGGQILPDPTSEAQAGSRPAENEYADVHLSPELLQDEREVRETDPGEHRVSRAEEKISGHSDAIAAVRSAQKRIGDPDLIQRIRASGLCDLAQRYINAGLGFVGGDALAWFASLCMLLTVSGWWRLALAAVALLLALLLSHYAQIIVESHFRDTTSVQRTIRNHRLALRRFGWASGLGLAIFLLLAVAPPSWSRWILVLAAVPTLLCNLTLPIVAAIARSLGQFLDKPAQWDALEYEIKVRQLAIRRLQQFLPPKPPPPDSPASASRASATRAGMVLLAIGILGATAGSVQAVEPPADACLYLVDPTCSGDTGDRDIATEFLAITAREQARASGCRLVAVGTIGTPGSLGPRTWLPLPDIAPDDDCEVDRSLADGRDLGPVRWFKNLNDGLREDCETRLRARRAKEAAGDAAFVGQLRAALTVKSTREWSPIRESIQGALDSNRFHLITVVTDGMENPDGPVTLRIPSHTNVVMILTRPSDPHDYARSREFARRWSANTGLLLVSVGDLGPGFWNSLLERR